MTDDLAPIADSTKDPILLGQTMVASYDEPAVLYNPQDGSIFANRHAASLRHYFEGNINSYTYADDGASLYDILNLYNGKKKGEYKLSVSAKI